MSDSTHYLDLLIQSYNNIIRENSIAIRQVINNFMTRTQHNERILLNLIIQEQRNRSRERIERANMSNTQSRDATRDARTTDARTTETQSNNTTSNNTDNTEYNTQQRTVRNTEEMNNDLNSDANNNINNINNINNNIYRQRPSSSRRNTVRTPINTMSRRSWNVRYNAPDTLLDSNIQIPQNTDLYESILNNFNSPEQTMNRTNTFNNVFQRPLTNVLHEFDTLLTENLTELLEPVTIRPSQQQITNATRNISFSDVIRPVNSQCPITLVEFSNNSRVMMILHCGHLFSPAELQNWFRYNVRCPMCRYDIRNYSRPETSGDNEVSYLSRSEVPIAQNRDSDDETSINGIADEEIIEEISSSTDGQSSEEVSDIDTELNNNNSLTNELYYDLYHSVQDQEEAEQEE